MKQRPKAVGKVGRAGRRKSSKRQNELKARNRDETLEQLAATSEILEAIGHSTFDLQTVLATLVKSAGRLCQAENVQIFLFDGEFYRLAADNGFSPAYQQYARDHPIRPGRDTLVARTALCMEPVQIPDALADPEYTYGGQKLGGYRTLLGVPLLRDKECLGVIALTRSKVRPFTDRQIALVTNFAAQAVIAIENARLLNELRESLENQTASADILRTIASSPADAERALDVIAETTARRFGASNVNIRLLDGNILRYVGSSGPMAKQIQKIFPEGPLDPNASSGRAILERRQIYLRADSGEQGMKIPSHGRAAGIVASIATPLIREGQAVGVLMVMRNDPRPLTETDLAQLSNFAAQAVIAIENARLLNELRQRTADLSEALEQQAAANEVLSIVAKAAGELELVF